MHLSVQAPNLRMSLPSERVIRVAWLHAAGPPAFCRATCLLCSALEIATHTLLPSALVAAAFTLSLGFTAYLLVSSPPDFKRRLKASCASMYASVCGRAWLKPRAANLCLSSIRLLLLHRYLRPRPRWYHLSLHPALAYPLLCPSCGTTVPESEYALGAHIGPAYRSIFDLVAELVTLSCGWLSL